MAAQEHTVAPHWLNERLVLYKDLQQAVEERSRPLGLQPIVLLIDNYGGLRDE